MIGSPAFFAPEHASAAPLIVNRYATYREKFVGIWWLQILHTTPTLLIQK